MTVDPPEVEERTFTLEEYERLPDEGGYRDELVRGRIVREPLPGAEHGWLTARLFHEIDARVRVAGLGLTLIETGFLLSVEPPTVRGPDVAFVGLDRLPKERLPKGFWKLAPDLAVEVVSPSNSAAEIQEKVLEYLSAGSRLVWVVDPKTQTVTAYRSPNDIRILFLDDVLSAEDILPGFQLALADLFAWRPPGS